MSDISKIADSALSDVIEAIGRQDRDGALRLALSAYESGVEHPLILLLVAEGMEADGRGHEALGLLRRVTSEAPDEAEGWRRLGGVLMRLGDLSEARRAFEAALDIDPEVYWTLCMAGAASFRASDLGAAEDFYRRAADLEPAQAEPLAALAAIAVRRENSQAARALAERALAIAPSLSAEIALGRADLLDGAPDRTVERMAPLLSLTGLDADSRVGLLDLRADAFDALDQPAKAFADYTERNKILEQVTAPRFQREITERRVDQARRLSAYFSCALGESWRSAAGADSGRPASGHVFLLGFPRSGTTLLEKALAGHPAAVTLEEVDHLGQAGARFLANGAALDRLANLSAADGDRCRQAYWRGVQETLGDACEGRVVVDKLPLHTPALPLISKLFPSAKILFALRDPRDVVLSCFRRRFQINAAMYEFLRLEGAANYYDQIMALARIYRALLPLNLIEVRHETLVDDFDGEVGKVLDFIDVGWDPAVRDFAERARARAVTPSDPQLARGLNADGVGQWRRYAEQMAGVLPRLEPWAQLFGYPPGPPPKPRSWGFGFKVG